jgi:hypothetical protein
MINHYCFCPASYFIGIIFLTCPSVDSDKDQMSPFCVLFYSYMWTYSEPAFGNSFLARSHLKFCTRDCIIIAFSVHVYGLEPLN